MIISFPTQSKGKEGYFILQLSKLSDCRVTNRELIKKIVCTFSTFIDH